MKFIPIVIGFSKHKERQLLKKVNFLKKSIKRSNRRSILLNHKVMADYIFKTIAGKCPLSISVS